MRMHYANGSARERKEVGKAINEQEKRVWFQEGWELPGLCDSIVILNWPDND